MVQIQITIPLVDWLLYNLPRLRALVDEPEGPIDSRPGVPITDGIDNPTCEAAVAHANLSAVLDATDRVIQRFHPETKKVYKAKYRRSLTYKQIAESLYLSKSTVRRRTEEIRTAVKGKLDTLHQSVLREFLRYVDH